ncbi:MAG: hypothetical protein H7Z43_05855, partial [Clostridia bacterium]|nr:hypothetical protein [Deltaproteobacteria bacterium]
EHHYFDMTPAILNLAFTDDPIATEHNVEDLLRLFPRATITRRRINPAEVGMKEVGHVGFFRRNAKALWPIAGDYLDAQSNSSQSVPSRGSTGGSARSG